MEFGWQQRKEKECRQWREHLDWPVTNTNRRHGMKDDRPNGNKRGDFCSKNGGDRWGKRARRTKCWAVVTSQCMFREPLFGTILERAMVRRLIPADSQTLGDLFDFRLARAPLSHRTTYRYRYITRLPVPLNHQVKYPGRLVRYHASCTSGGYAFNNR
jgi:hypothetical protein